MTESHGRDYYQGFLEGSGFDLDLLLHMFSVEELEPHLDYLTNYCNHTLDLLEQREQKEKTSPYNYFIHLLKTKNNLDLDKTIKEEPFIYMAYKGLITRTYYNLTQKVVSKEEFMKMKKQVPKKKAVKKTVKRQVK